MTAIIACALAAMVLALLQRPPPVLSATLSLTFNRCAITWSDVQQVNATIQCRRSELSARMHNFHVLDGLWVNITASSQPIGRHGDELSYSTVASADLDICEFIDGAGSGHGFYAEIFRSLQRQPEHHLIDQCPVQPDVYYLDKYSFNGANINALLLNVNLRLTVGVRDKQRPLYAFVIYMAIRRGTSSGKRLILRST